MDPETRVAAGEPGRPSPWGRSACGVLSCGRLWILGTAGPLPLGPHRPVAPFGATVHGSLRNTSPAPLTSQPQARAPSLVESLGPGTHRARCALPGQPSELAERTRLAWTRSPRTSRWDCDLRPASPTHRPQHLQTRVHCEPQGWRPPALQPPISPSIRSWGREGAHCRTPRQGVESLEVSGHPPTPPLMAPPPPRLLAVHWAALLSSCPQPQTTQALSPSQRLCVGRQTAWAGRGRDRDCVGRASLRHVPPTPHRIT